MGITMVALGEGKVQLLHSFHNAKSPEDAERGLIFMQEMVELSKSNTIPNTQLQAVAFKPEGDPELHILEGGPSHFSIELVNDMSIEQRAVFARPPKACTALQNANEILGKVVIMERGDCTFVDKARRAQSAGAVAAIVFDNTPNTSINNQQMFAMSGDGRDDVQIPVVFLFTKEAEQLIAAVKQQPGLELTLMSVSGLKDKLAKERADTIKTDTKSASKATP